MIMETSNEQKAKEFATTEDGNIVSFAYIAAMRMAQWKDEQYNEEKRELLGLVKMLEIDEQNQTIIEDLVAILNS